jgi:hypothetical protein
MSEMRRDALKWLTAQMGHPIAAQLGHTSRSTVAQYMKHMTDSDEARQRDFVSEFLHGVFDENCDSPRRETLRETTMGTCPSRPLDRICEAGPCLSAPDTLWDPIAWDFPDSMYYASAQFPSNLVRCWSDLDQTAALNAHLSGLDEALR